MVTHIRILLVLILVNVSHQGSLPCYYPDSSIASDFNYTTCNLNSSNEYSSCCSLAEGDICLSDGLCYWPTQPDGHGNYIYRAACTDKSWTDSACPQACTVDDPNHFETVSFCPNTTDFCCAKSTVGDCCQYPDLRFNLTIPAYIFADLKNGTANAPATNVPGQGSTAPATGGKPAGGNSAEPSASSSLASPKKSGLSTGAAAGIAVAVTFILAGIAVGGFILWWKRRGARPPQDSDPFDAGKAEVIVSRSMSGLEVTAGSIHGKAVDDKHGDSSRRESQSQRNPSAPMSPTKSRNTSVALENVVSNTDSSPLAEEEQPDPAIYEANGHGPTSESQLLDGRHIGAERYELHD